MGIASLSTFMAVFSWPLGLRFYVRVLKATGHFGVYCKGMFKGGSDAKPGLDLLA